MSIGSVTGTDHLKGPCDSYSRGPFVHFRPVCRADPVGGPRGRRASIPLSCGYLGIFCGWHAPICGGRGEFRWNQENVDESPCAPTPAGHRTAPTPSGNGRRDSSETRVHTTKNQLAGDASRRLGDEAAGTGVEEQSIGSVTSTGHQKGPWNSYFRGPFACCGRSPSARVVSRNRRTRR
jgi:hypothetical protein